ncbi:MAG: NrsF family protein [Alphaproteobacteria bacterium]
MTTDTDKLISDLTKDLKPVKRLPRVALRAGLWAVFTLGAIAVAICAFTKGPREDLHTAAHNHVFCCETLAILVAGVLATVAAFRLCVPDVKVRGVVQAMTGLATFIWLTLIGAQVHRAGLVPPEPAGEPCLTDLSLFMAVPLLGAVFMVMRAASVFPALAGYCAVLATGSFGALGMRLLCANDEPAHLLVWHFLPVMIFALCGLPLGKILLKMQPPKKIAT